MKKRFTEEQMIKFLQEAEAGIKPSELSRKHAFSQASFTNWKYRKAAQNIGSAAKDPEAPPLVSSTADNTIATLGGSQPVSSSDAHTLTTSVSGALNDTNPYSQQAALEEMNEALQDGLESGQPVSTTAANVQQAAADNPPNQPVLIAGTTTPQIPKPYVTPFMQGAPVKPKPDPFAPPLLAPLPEPEYPVDLASPECQLPPTLARSLLDAQDNMKGINSAIEANNLGLQAAGLSTGVAVVSCPAALLVCGISVGIGLLGGAAGVSSHESNRHFKKPYQRAFDDATQAANKWKASHRNNKGIRCDRE